MRLIPNHVEELLNQLADELQISEARFETAERSYKSVARWLGRPESTLSAYEPDVYVQGSFRLGTAIKLRIPIDPGH